MTPIAPHMSAFLRERLPLQRGASAHTCDSYAYAFQLLFHFASERFQIGPNPTFMSSRAIRGKNRQMKELSDDLLHPCRAQHLCI